MPQSPSPTTSPSPKSTITTPKDAPISSQTVPEDIEMKKTVFRPKLAFVGLEDTGASNDGRRPSIQFASSAETPVRESRQRVPSMKLQRRLSSPPPPSTGGSPAQRVASAGNYFWHDRSGGFPAQPTNENDPPQGCEQDIRQEDKQKRKGTYKLRVGFDTSENKSVTDFSFAMSSKHKDYKWTKRSRTFLCGTDENDYSEFALEWLLERLVDENDEIVCLRVVTPDPKSNVDASVLQAMYKEEAKRLLDHFQEKNEDGIPISLVVELAVGQVEETFQRMIKTYSPASLVVGTKGKSLGGIQGLRKGSVSKYCLQTSPVPVIVVRPKDKRMKKKARRTQDPKRQNYKSILEQSNASGFDALAQAQQSDNSGTETEANAVAKAIGLDEDVLSLDGRNHRLGSAEGGESSRLGLTRTTSQRSDTAYETESPSPTGPLLVIDDERGDVPEMHLPGTLDDAGGGDEQVVAATGGTSSEGKIENEKKIAEGRSGEEKTAQQHEEKSEGVSKYTDTSQVPAHEVTIASQDKGKGKEEV